jgi:hypothetical protein
MKLSVFLCSALNCPTRETNDTLASSETVWKREREYAHMFVRTRRHPHPNHHRTSRRARRVEEERYSGLGLVERDEREHGELHVPSSSSGRPTHSRARSVGNRCRPAGRSQRGGGRERQRVMIKSGGDVDERRPSSQ